MRREQKLSILIEKFLIMTFFNLISLVSDALSQTLLGIAVSWMFFGVMKIRLIATDFEFLMRLK